MTAMTDYLEKALLDHVLGLTAYTKPSTTYVSAHTADPTDTGSQSNEPAGNGYARQSATAAMAATNATTGVSVNSTVITFGPCTTSGWGTITAAAFGDSLTTGNLLLHGLLTSSRTIAVGDSLQIAASQLSVTFA